MTRPAAPALRGTVVGALTVGLASAAHGSAGGMCPSARGVALLVMAAAAIGAVVAVATRSAGLPRSRTALVIALLGGQAAGHTVLMLVGAHHGAGQAAGGAMHMPQGAPGLGMAAAHLVASILCTVLVTAAESLYGPIISAIRRLAPIPPPAPARPDVPVARPAGRAIPVHSAPPISTLSRRGPPARCVPRMS